MEYCSHISRGAPKSSLGLLNKVQSETIRLRRSKIRSQVPKNKIHASRASLAKSLCLMHELNPTTLPSPLDLVNSGMLYPLTVSQTLTACLYSQQKLKKLDLPLSFPNSFSLSFIRAQLYAHKPFPNIINLERNRLLFVSRKFNNFVEIFAGFYVWSNYNLLA